MSLVELANVSNFELLKRLFGGVTVNSKIRLFLPFFEVSH